MISGEEGIRKPDRTIYELALKRMELDAAEIVFVDDLAGNLKPARELGMETVHHSSGGETVTQLERLFGIRLCATPDRPLRREQPPRRRARRSPPREALLGALLEVAHVRDEQRGEGRGGADEPAGDQRAADADRGGDGARQREAERQQADRDQPVEARNAAQHRSRDMPLLDGRPDDRARRLERVERQARQHQLPERRREPVSDDRERRRRPDHVHEGDEAPREPALAHDDRAGHRAQPARGEDEAQIGRGSAEVVLDEQRDEDLHRPHEAQVGHGGARERRPQPRPAPDVAPALEQLARGGAMRRRRRALRGGIRSISSAPAEIRNDAPSRRNTDPAPATAIRMPPSAGPAIRRTSGRASWSSALACASRSLGRSSGTIASNAGAKNAAAVP